MAADNGRNLVLSRTLDGGTTYIALAAVQEKTVTFNAEAVDVTTDDSDGWRTSLTEPATRSVDISVSGVAFDEILIGAINVGTGSFALEAIRVTYPDGAISEGNFNFTSLERSGSHDGAVTFSASFASTGAITYTAAP